jgi:hypothetical protein
LKQFTINTNQKDEKIAHPANHEDHTRQDMKSAQTAVRVKPNKPMEFAE